MKIRAVTATDYQQWLSLWDGYQTFYKVNMDNVLAQHTFERLLDSHQAMYAWVVEDEGKLIALVHFVFHLSTWSKGEYCYLQDLFVHPDYRSQGLARKLIEKVYAIATERDCSRVYWLTHKDNETARHLYDQVAQSTGFIQYHKQLI